MLLALLGFEAFYLIAANVFLNTGVGPWTVNRKPEKWTLKWDGGWSLIPTRFHMSGPVFERNGRRVEVSAGAREIRFRVELLPLLTRRFVAEDLTIEQLSLAFDRRSGEAPPKRARSSAEPGWRFELSDVVVDRIESVRFEELELGHGHGRFSGDFKVQVRGDLELPRATLSWSDAALRQGGDVLAEPMELRFDGTLSPLNPRRDTGFAVIDHLGGVVEVEGRVTRLAILEDFFAHAKWVEYLDGHGRLSAKLLLEDGWLKPGSELTADAEALRFDFLGYATEGSGRVRGSVNDGTLESGESDAPGPVRLEVAFDDFTVRRKPATEPHVRGQDFRLVATTSDLRQGGLSDLEVTIDMPRAEVPDVGVYSAYLPPDLGLAIESGAGVVGLHLKAESHEETASGHLTFDAKKVTGRFQDLGFQTGLEVRTRISGGDLDDFRLDIEGTSMKLTNGVFRDHRNTDEKDWWMTVDVPRGSAFLGGEALGREAGKALGIEAGETPGLEAEVELAMRDTRVLIAMFAELKSWLQRFERILTVKDVTGSARVNLRGQHLSLSDVAISGRKLRGRAQLELSEARQEGIFFLRFRGFEIGLERRGGEQDWKLTGVEKWFDRRVAESWRQ